MKTEEIALSRVSENEANPRTITEANFQKLVKSILVFPKMLQLRPIVVDETYKALGGNMRTRALCHIVSMTPEAIMDVLDTDQRLTDAEKLAIANYWSQWKEQPTATIVKASDLTEAQKKEFIIKDNAGFGDWNTEELANQFGDQPLTDWAIPQWILGMAGISNEQKEGGNTSTEGEGAPKPSLVDKFVVPPFSILDTRQGYWVERKKQWRNIVSSKDIGASREQTLVRSKEMRYKELYSKSEKFRKEKGISFDEYLENYVSPEEKPRQTVAYWRRVQAFSTQYWLKSSCDGSASRTERLSTHSEENRQRALLLARLATTTKLWKYARSRSTSTQRRPRTTAA